MISPLLHPQMKNTQSDLIKDAGWGIFQTNYSRVLMVFSAALQPVIVYSVLHSVFFAMRCLFWDSNHFVCVCVCVCVFVLAWHLSFHRGCLPDRERGAHTKSVYGGGRLKAIIIYPRMHRGNGGSVKAFSQKEAPWMAAMQKKKKKKTHLSQSCFEAWCAGRPTLPKEAEGQGCSRILHPNRHKGLTLTLFQRSSAACLGCGCLHVRLSLCWDSLPPAASCSFTSDHICKLFPVLWKQPQSLGRTRGIPQECVSRRLSHGFLRCQPKWNVMSCQENCEAISEPSSVRSVTCESQAPGACLGHWALTGTSLPSLVSCRGSFLFPSLTVSLTSSFVSCSTSVSLTSCCSFVPRVFLFTMLLTC